MGRLGLGGGGMGFVCVREELRSDRNEKKFVGREGKLALCSGRVLIGLVRLKYRTDCFLIFQAHFRNIFKIQFFFLN